MAKKIKMSDIINPKYAGTRRKSAFINMDTDVFAEKILKIQKASEEIADSKKLAEDLATNLLAISYDYIPYRDEYRLKKPNKNTPESKFKIKSEGKTRSHTSISQEIVNALEKGDKEYLGYVSEKTIKTIGGGKKANEAKNVSLVGNKGSKVIRDKSGNLKAIESYEPDESWNGRITAGYRKYTTSIRKGKTKRLSAQSITETENISGTSEYVNTPNVTKKYSILSKNKDDNYYKGYGYIVKQSKGAYLDPATEQFVRDVKLPYGVKSATAELSWRRDEKTGAVIPYRTHKVKDTEKYYGDRPPHLRDIPDKQVVSVVKSKNGYVAKFKYSIKKPLDDNFYDNKGEDYAAIQYYGIDHNGDITGDKKWKRFTKGTTSRWLEAAVGMKVPNVKGINRTDAKTNYEDLVSVVAAALKKQIK